MALLGKAALAMWWNMAPDMKEDFEDWHSHEHFPERLGVPGFLRSSRWIDAGGAEGVFVVYELASHEVLASAPYLDRLNDPTPWSRKLMPYHSDMVRSQAHVRATHGGLVARHALTVRLEAQAGQAETLAQKLMSMVGKLPDRPGLTGAHVLQHEAPAIPQTTEQKIRKAPDRAAPLVLVVTGYDLPSLKALAVDGLSDDALRSLGAAPGSTQGFFSLAHSAVPSDVR